MMIEFHAGEQLIAIERRHWFVFLLIVLRTALGIVAVIVAALVAQWISPELYGTYVRELWLGAALLIEMLWVFFFFQVADYYLDVWVITTERLVLIELKGIFNRSVTSIDLRNIQDVASNIVGIIPMLLNYGDVKVQSAGTLGEFIFREVPKPDQCKDAIIKARQGLANPSA